MNGGCPTCAPTIIGPACTGGCASRLVIEHLIAISREMRFLSDEIPLESNAGAWFLTAAQALERLIDAIPGAHKAILDTIHQG